MPDRTLSFVTSTSGNARLAHVASGAHGTVCGLYLMTGVRRSVDMPADRRMCRRCAKLGVTGGLLAAAEADVLLAHVPCPADRNDLVTLLRETADAAVARNLGVSVGTLSRRVRAAMQDVGTRTRFDFGWRAAQRAGAGLA